ncbi:S41 family peptidase [Sphingomonas sp. S2-65]|uniref:S41 family peptidase n=1 Tax=Sphingomonas sp. S2-65 TaxID=2903960 RepID=UPI001F28016C|nr:S41 family peptidase [Sphingomonas sp. S2-65]UYY57360.1 S41 family peptidase [Sphingomonas sp. S2-65]
MKSKEERVVKHSRFGALLSAVALLSACGGGGGSGNVAVGGGTGGGGTTGGSPTPTPTAGCTLRDRQNWAFSVLKEWYLFPETLPASLDPSGYATLESYVDALTATARGQNKDRYFTYVTSIAQENAYYSTGSSAGFGFRLSYDTNGGRVFVAESFEGAPALAAGIDRGAEILAVSGQPVSTLLANGGPQAVVNAFGPDTAGTSRVLRIQDSAGARDITVAKADYTLTPVSSRYGVKILDNGGQRVGYVNLRTFIDTADPALRAAFAQFRAQGITNVIVDLRYNGGGLVSIAELMGDLLGANRTSSDVFSFTTFRPEKSSFNDVDYFAPQPQSIAPTRVAFIGTGGTASASELTINGMLPYLRANEALVGGNTYGKPVGQIAVDKTACDDRVRVIAFATENRDHQGAYYDGLASKMDVTCRAADDLSRPMGDPAEASTRVALDFLAGRSCTPILGAAAQLRSLSASSAAREPLMPDRPSTVQREVPGAF